MTRSVAVLDDRACVRVGGPDWRGFLQGLLSQDVDTLAPGELRFGALLTPQGRILFDLFILGLPHGTGVRLDAAADRRDALVERLGLYRLRAKVEIAADNTLVFALWGGAAGDPWGPDPRLPALGWRAYARGPAPTASLADYHRHRLGLGVPDTADWGADRSYPIEADFDLLNGLDFHKGCFVGQETTSRMKRRGQVKSRMAAIRFEGPAPAPGAELLAGDLRAGEALTGTDGVALALLRLDRLESGPRTLPDGRPWTPDLPAWMAPALP
ncbi:MAG: folate-binding protein YgfZ [Caulobacteraceae bacterium]|nr:folate-binding protein YgfZ [Caulobacteraceae bacterium]